MKNYQNIKGIIKRILLDREMYIGIFHEMNYVLLLMVFSFLICFILWELV